MKEILLLSPFSLQGTYAEKNLQKNEQVINGNKPKINKNLFSSGFFNEKKLDKLYQLKNELARVNGVYFVLTKQIIHPDFNDYFINLIIAIHQTQPEFIIIDTSICDGVYCSQCHEVIEMIKAVFQENEFPVIYINKNEISLENNLTKSANVEITKADKKFIFKIHESAKAIFNVKNQIMNSDDLLVPVANQPHKKTFNWHNHSYNLN